MPVLTGIDLLSVQRYVFASNRLRDAVAASWLADWATSAGGALHDSGGDVLLASGGNAILRFTDKVGAREFAARYTRRLHDEAPGLESVVVHRGYASGGIAAALRQLQVDLACSKLERIPSAPRLGLSVNAACRITGLPATGFDPDDPSVPLSPKVLRWRHADVRASAATRWESFLTDGGFALPPEIDDMGRTRGDTSLIGVVHVDGNDVGRRISEWLRACAQESRPDVIVLDQMREWSAALVALGNGAVRAIIERAPAAVTDDRRESWLQGRVPELRFQLGRSGGSILLPLRPVLLGGDDLTFLCDGRIALDLAETALDAFSGNLPHLGLVTACAGVAIVPAHTPFDRAYELAEALCAHAKRRRHEEDDAGSWMDWHIGPPGPGESVEELRARAYSHTAGPVELALTCRPYRLGSATGGQPESWRWLSRTLLGTDGDAFRGDQWRQHRNKIKELAPAIREGSAGVRRALEAWTVAGTLPLPGGLDEVHGFLDGARTPLLDAIELLDIHLPLGKESP
jgi:hypothetical protein